MASTTNLCNKKLRIVALALFMTLGLSACKSSTDATGTETTKRPCWATVSEVSVSQALRERLYAEHPEIPAVDDRIRELKEKKNRLTSHRHLEDAIREAGCVRDRPRRPGTVGIGTLADTDIDCVDAVRRKLENGPKAREAKRLAAMIESLQRYQREVDNYVTAQTLELIQQYAKGRFAVVISAQEPIYSEALYHYDITDALEADLINNATFPSPPKPPGEYH